MTPEQKAALKAYILADPVLSTMVSGPGTDYGFISSAMNAKAVPDFYVWRTSVTAQELRAAAMVGATQLDALTASKRDSLLWVIGETIDFTVATSRSAIDDLCGSQNILKAALQAVQREVVSVAEKVLAVGTGTQAVPATATWRGSLSIGDISSILSL